MNDIKFTREQEIHNLGFAKEQLKSIIFDTEDMTKEHTWNYLTAKNSMNS